MQIGSYKSPPMTSDQILVKNVCLCSCISSGTYICAVVNAPTRNGCEGAKAAAQQVNLARVAA